MAKAKKTNLYPLEWHEDCLKANLAYIELQERQLERLRYDIEKVKEKAQRRSEAIAAAKAEGLTEFPNIE
jgi:hypothetical protein